MEANLSPFQVGRRHLGEKELGEGRRANGRFWARQSEGNRASSLFRQRALGRGAPGHARLAGFGRMLGDQTNGGEPKGATKREGHFQGENVSNKGPRTGSKRSAIKGGRNGRGRPNSLGPCI